jgi:hypothetical protein
LTLRHLRVHGQAAEDRLKLLRRFQIAAAALLGFVRAREGEASCRGGAHMNYFNASRPFRLILSQALDPGHIRLKGAAPDSGGRDKWQCMPE